MVAAYLRPALPRKPVLYLMAPMSMYGSAALEAAREYPFAALTGCEVTVWCAEDMYRDNKQWAAYWPLVARQAVFGVFLDLGGWVARGVRVETLGLLNLGRRVWWFNQGEPTERFGFSASNYADFKYRHCRVGLGYGRPVRRVRDHPLEAPEGVVAWR